MRTLQWQGRLLLLAMLAAFVAPSLAQADHGRRGRDRARVVIRGDVGRYDHDRGYRDYSGYRDGWHNGRRVGWRGCDLPPGLAKKYGCYRGYGYSRYPSYPREYPRRYPRRGSVGVVIHIPF